MAVTVNSEGYERRLAVIAQLVHNRGLQASNISTLAYNEEYKYRFNNYLFKVELATPASSSLFPGTQPGTTKAPSEGISTLVIKLSNVGADGINNANRVENDVAMQYIVRQSMAQAGLAPLVAHVYAWAPATTTNAADEKGFGWIMSELKSGVDLDIEFPSLGLKDKAQVLEQIAAALGAIQRAPLPEGVNKFGGLTFDSSGQIVSGESPQMKGKPVDSYIDWKMAKLQVHLKDADESAVIQGWKRNGINKRIQDFIASRGPERVLAGVDVHQKGIIYGDFTMNNMLFDKESKKITALVDFDFAYISNPFDEFMTALVEIGGNTGNINTAMAPDDFSTRPANLDRESINKWEVANAWNAAMKKSCVVTPKDIKGADKIRELLQLQNLICPYQLGSESAHEIDDEKKAELLAKTEADLVQWLEKQGF